jgi:adenylate cyclase
MTRPTNHEVQRRLAAVLAADVVGYSGLMGEDEEGTLARLKSLRREVFEPNVKANRGRIVKTTGDGILVEFASPVDAVRSAVAVQNALGPDRAADLSPSLQVRIGINLGDIIFEEDGDIFGDGVNVAARLEQMADPGSILVSRKVYDEVQGKVAVEFENRGEHEIRNLGRTVGVYAVTTTALGKRSGPARREGAAAEPTIAVLPFANNSEDEKQSYLSNGFTEDIITELSRFTQLSVVSMNTSLQFKDHGVQSAAQSLGVQYLLEGSVRRRGDRLRITCQLMDTATGNHIWAERFDREAQGIFDIQDELVRIIVGTLVGRVQAAGVERARRKPPKNLAAYECVLRGNALPMGDPEAEAEARRWYTRAIELDPTYGRAYAKLAHYLQLDWFRATDDSNALLNEALEIAKHSVALAPNDPVCLNILGWVHVNRQEFDIATRYYERALELNPNDPEQVAFHGTLYTFLGEPERALSLFEQARNLDRFYDPPWFLPFQGMAHFLNRRFEPAIAALSLSPTMPVWVRAYLAACNALLGKHTESGQQATTLLRIVPGFSAQRFSSKEPLRCIEHRTMLLDGLRASGLPE